MRQFLLAHAADGDAEALVGSCLEQLGPIPAAANLGFVYVGDTLAGHLDVILQRLRSAAPQVHWTGSVGTAICATDHEYYDTSALAVMVGAFAAETFRPLPVCSDVAAALPPELSDWCRRQGYCFALVHGDPANTETPALVEAIAAAMPAGFINGGLTSSNTGNYQIADGAAVSGGVSGVLFAPEANVVTDHTQGCSPIGPAHEITKAQVNIAVTLDGRPALEVMKEEIGETLARDLQRIAGYIFVALPVAGSDTGDYLVRHLLALDTGKGMVAVGDYLDGYQRLMFCRRDGNTAREDMRLMLERIRKRVDGRTIRGGVYVTCVGRGRHQFGDQSEELRLISAALGEFPLVGFFASGELYNGRLYGYTGVLTLFL